MSIYPGFAHALVLDAASCRLIRDNVPSLEVSLQVIEKAQQCSQVQALQFAISRIKFHYSLALDQNPYWTELAACLPLFEEVLKSMKACERDQSTKVLNELILLSKEVLVNYCP